MHHSSNFKLRNQRVVITEIAVRRVDFPVVIPVFIRLVGIAPDRSIWTHRDTSQASIRSTRLIFDERSADEDPIQLFPDEQVRVDDQNRFHLACDGNFDRPRLGADFSWASSESFPCFDSSKNHSRFQHMTVNPGSVADATEPVTPANHTNARNDWIFMAMGVPLTIQ